MKNTYSQLDNYFLADLLETLTSATTLSRYFPLIELKTELQKELFAKGLVRKYDYLSASTTMSCLDESDNALFRRFLCLYDFVPRKLNQFIDNDDSIARVKQLGIGNSGDFITYFRSTRPTLPTLTLTKSMLCATLCACRV